MWKWHSELHERGFRRRSDRYWRCERGYGLPTQSYLSIFVDASLRERDHRLRIDFASFHVTFRVGVDHVHFYYHELDDQTWESGGHTSLLELDRLGLRRDQLREQADQIARELLSSFGVELLPRHREE